MAKTDDPLGPILDAVRGGVDPAKRVDTSIPQTKKRRPLGDRRGGPRALVLFREVEKLLSMGCRRHEILKILGDQWPEKLSVRTVDRYITEVYDAWRAHAAEHTDDNRLRILRMFDQATQIAFAQKDPRAIALLGREIAKVLGLYAPQVIEVGGAGMSTSGDLRNQLAAAITSLEDERATARASRPNGHGGNGHTA